MDYFDNRPIESYFTNEFIKSCTDNKRNFTEEAIQLLKCALLPYIGELDNISDYSLILDKLPFVIEDNINTKVSILRAIFHELFNCDGSVTCSVVTPWNLISNSKWNNILFKSANQNLLSDICINSNYIPLSYNIVNGIITFYEVMYLSHPLTYRNCNFEYEIHLAKQTFRYEEYPFPHTYNITINNRIVYFFNIEVLYGLFFACFLLKLNPLEHMNNCYYFSSSHPNMLFSDTYNKEEQNIADLLEIFKNTYYYTQLLSIK